MIQLTELQIVDLALRCASVGGLLILVLFVVQDRMSPNRIARGLLLFCIMAYVLLTAPVENHHYGFLRPVLMLFTDATSYVLFAVYWHSVRGRSIFHNMPKWAILSIAFWFVWLGYFFLVQEGRGIFHTVHHGIGFTVLLAIVIDAWRDFDDDLVEARRNTRKLTIVFLSAYMLVLTFIELLLKPLKDDGLFSIINALMILLLVMGFAWRRIGRLMASDNDIKSQTHGSQRPHTLSMAQALTAKMEQGFYATNGLTIAKLAEEMAVPEHQLRVVINQHLGFDNFSQFLNSYRIPAVTRRLQDPRESHIPVLTLALESGFNSIAPFNRAFKAITGVTPTEYRRQQAADFQK